MEYLKNICYFFFPRISFCSADAYYDRVVAFIGTNKNETLECHAFLCSKRKVAEAAALTISQAFNIAFELWERAKEEKSSQSREVIFYYFKISKSFYYNTFIICFCFFNK